MIALIPSDADLDRLVLDVPDAEPREQLHLTLWYLGDAADLGEEICAGLVTAVSQMIERRALPPMDGIAFGVNYWNPSSDDPSWVLAVGDPPVDEMSDAQKEIGGFSSFKHMMKEAWEDSLIFFNLPPQHTPYVPHVCLIYGAEVGTDLIESMTERLGPVTFDKVRLAFAGKIVDIPLIDKSANDQLAALYANEKSTADTDCGCTSASDQDFGPSQSVSDDSEWNGSPSAFTDEQYKMSTAACDPGDAPIKTKCFLPHHNPGGALNRSGLSAAAGRVNSLSGRSSAAVERAKSHLRSHYKALGEDPPDSLASSGSTVEFGSRINEMSEIERGYFELMAFLRSHGWMK
jgi:2'-5' RNA ligase